jgi:8-amino-7-oxononanoate synthase
MDGDVAPLKALHGVAIQRGATLVIDDAHGFGVIGATGRGSLEYCGVTPREVPIYMATLGKAAGVFGAFVAGSEALIEMLIQKSRTYIYTTAVPAAVAAATRAALKIVQSEPWRREHLQSLIAQFRAGARELGLALIDSPTPIQPLVLGDETRVLAASERLLEHGFLGAAIRPPTVPQGTARLRITFSAAHETQDVQRLLEALSHLPHEHDS